MDMSKASQNLLSSHNLAHARFNMVENQVRAGGMHNGQVIKAMAEITRENFVPSNESALAYADINLMLGATNRFLLAPLILARMIDALTIHEGDLVLDIGCTTGYSVAVLAHLVGIGTVVGLEQDPISPSKPPPF